MGPFCGSMNGQDRITPDLQSQHVWLMVFIDLMHKALTHHYLHARTRTHMRTRACILYAYAYAYACMLTRHTDTYMHTKRSRMRTHTLPQQLVK